jgi:hypothetical protein
VGAIRATLIWPAISERFLIRPDTELSALYVGRPRTRKSAAVDGMAPSQRSPYHRAMRYNVTLSAPGIKPKTYNVEGDTETEATTKAASRFLKEQPHLTEFDLKVVGVNAQGT